MCYTLYSLLVVYDRLALWGVIMRQRRKSIKKVLTCLLIIFIVCTLYAAFDIYSYGNINELNNADAAIILGAAVWGDKPSPVFEERIKHGIWLYKS